MASPRPTPVEPLPHLANTELRQAQARALPPELGPNAIALVNGATFMYSDQTGDVPTTTIGGLVHADTRLLNRWELTLNGARLMTLRSTVLEYYLGQFILTHPAMPGIPADSLSIRRLRHIGDAMHERVEIESFLGDPVRCELRLAVGTDFADLFEIKSAVTDRSSWIRRDHELDGSGLCFRYEREGFHAESRLRVDPPADRIEGDELVWDLTLACRRPWTLDAELLLPRSVHAAPSVRADIDDVFHNRVEHPARNWLAGGPSLHSDNTTLNRVAMRSRWDLTALRLEFDGDGKRLALPAAGMPWFLALFGRDTLLTAFQTIAGNPRLAKGALLALAQSQGRTCDDFTDEEPGRILHEVRHGELTRRGAMPYRPYYGAADATQLWLILLSEYWRWTMDDDFVRALRDNITAALHWIDHYGDRDGDGYVEYATRSPEGLGNQCWRDSSDGIRFADGRMPVLPIATCEVQGYTYDAKRRIADLADGPLGDPELAARLRAQAHDLYERFNRDFWIDGRGGYYAVGLDGDKHRIDSLTSNLGHLLWSGIVTPDRAGQVARQLTSPAMFSGWGIRTMSHDDVPFNPIGYHLGTVWPHDNALAVLGLVRYGFRDEANRVTLALLDAAAEFDFRLPEALSGFDRQRTRVAVPYPTACSPQAWAAAVPVTLVRAMLGLDAVDGRLVVDPEVPAEVGRLHVSRILALGRRWDIEATGTTGSVRPSPD
ncbi:amylo-alpha-1,6-glucosidase [Micromonospora coxensis]|uniref:Glycogen debranching enzyme (Alpha-1,6-glucosidase) n=1 Tax=Micromonospora coxensis TaxID=356852 RepID=A0A1C5GVQ3_9ACTN|nr:glycogen debranching N-terminal domain-containing protein [Micromonospora coxensis]SCG37848.1 Glycogen debranching enzyme (alpha-1,6-glucosidase) [Micromonospora coxensis]